MRTTGSESRRRRDVSCPSATGKPLRLACVGAEVENRGPVFRRSETGDSKVRGLMARLLSVNVGLPREIAWRGKTVYTSVWKEAVQGRRLVRRLNIDGDAQGDLAGHGGEHRAVFVYQMDSYHYWQRELKRADFTFGQFGENFTAEGLADSEVCVGDRYRIGGALFEVTQPRVTCYRVGLRMDEPRMAALLVAHHRPGSIFASWKRVRWAPAMKLSRLPKALNASRSPRSTRCSIFPDPPRMHLSGRCASRP